MKLIQNHACMSYGENKGAEHVNTAGQLEEHFIVLATHSNCQTGLINMKIQAV